jgi:hypothetical protein
MHRNPGSDQPETVLVIVDDFDVHGVERAVRPLKANPPSIVDTDAELTCAVTSQRFEAIAWQAHECLPVGSGFKDLEPFVRLARERLKLLDSFTGGKSGGTLIPILWRARRVAAIPAHHAAIMACKTLYVKRNTPARIFSVTRALAWQKSEVIEGSLLRAGRATWPYTSR